VRGEGSNVCGHKSLSIILHFVQILLSVFDPDSTVFSLRKGRKTSLRLAQRWKLKQFSFQNKNPIQSNRVFILPLCAP